jgi:NAD(P)-dependent dehydrogenase (short-subunit alcohol dehydrogenase family)
MPTALVTGANRGIGLEFARQYRAEGWRVLATVRDPAQASELAETGAELHPLDVTDHAAIARLGETLSGESIDVLIVNAGVPGELGMRPERFDEARWIEALRVNAIAPLAVAGALREAVARSGERKMVALSSKLASMSANVTGGHYGYRSSKAALNAVWRSLAVDWPEIVTALLHPGWVRTGMGGRGAEVTAADSVAGMRRVIARLTPADTGGFFSHEGEKLPW